MQPNTCHSVANLQGIQTVWLFWPMRLIEFYFAVVFLPTRTVVVVRLAGTVCAQVKLALLLFSAIAYKFSLRSVDLGIGNVGR